MGAKLARKLVKVKVRGAPDRIELEQDAVGAAAQNAEDAPQIDFAKAAVAQQQHHSRHEDARL